MGRRRLPPGVWVFFDKPSSVRHGLVGKVLPVPDNAKWHSYRMVAFPLMPGDPWRCAFENLRGATEEEVAITIAKAAFGIKSKHATKQVWKY